MAEAGSTFRIFKNALLSEGPHLGRTCVLVHTEVDGGQADLLDPKVLIFDARAPRPATCGSLTGSRKAAAAIGWHTS